VCGICGELRFDDQPPSTDAVRRMSETMRPRGPDGAGLHWQARAALGHCRLKIIDLSDAAAQPMVDPHLGLTLVFNGCIYNYPDLRRQLEQKGYSFFSHGDTEVILKAYHAWGDKCVERFNGMFAFVIVERDGGRVFAARDRLGIKPFYYADDGDKAFRFASSLPALLKAGGIDTRIDPVALHYYMTFHAVVPPPHTILRGVKKLPPGTTLTIEPDGKRTQRTFWRPSFTRDAEERKYTIEDWKRLTHDALARAINRRMIADVPVGVLLSGGLDSSLVVGLLAEAGQRGLNTFSIGFETVGDECGDEFAYSDLVAERFETQHHKICVDSSRALPALRDCIAAMSEPMVSHDAIGFYLLSQEVAKHVKVVQSGQGADEVFAGYHWYPPLLDADDSCAVTTYNRAFFDRDHAEFARAVSPRYVGEDHSSAFVAAHFAQRGADEPIDKALRLDSTIMLVDDPVKRVDNMTMAWGLEARVPFLDHELVELAARVPGRFKTRPMDQWEKTGGKYVLQEVARQVVPAEVIDRPKGYFPVPALKYLRGDYLEMVREVLHQPAARQRGLFNPGYVDELLAEPEKHITPLRGSKLWQVALLETWLQVQGV
jgi:asparagine synthase (glutamine-hydrolysing)